MLTAAAEAGYDPHSEESLKAYRRKLSEDAKARMRKYSPETAAQEIAAQSDGATVAANTAATQVNARGVCVSVCTSGPHDLCVLAALGHTSGNASGTVGTTATTI